MEFNGPSNIITEIEASLATGVPVDLKKVLYQAWMIQAYMQALALNPAIKWHQVLALNKEMVTAKVAARLEQMEKRLASRGGA